jgi:hypothetical protein
MMRAAINRVPGCRKVEDWHGREIVCTCADGVPSARILDCARTKRLSAHNRGSLKRTASTAFAFIQNRDFGTDALFIRTKITVGARSAQVFLRRNASANATADIARV